MATIYDLQARATALRGKTEAESITPDEVGGLHADTLAYIAEMEQSADGLGIRKVYATKAAMEADTAPKGTNGKPLRYGQLVCIYNAAQPETEGSGDIYAWQKPGWLLMGNISNIYELKSKIEAEATARAEGDSLLQKTIENEAAARTKADNTIQKEIETEATARSEGDEALQKAIDAEAAVRVKADSDLQEAITTETTARAKEDTRLQGEIERVQRGAVRFDGFEHGVPRNDLSTEEIVGVYYDTEYKYFVGKTAEGIYVSGWPGSELFMDGGTGSVLKDKVYICGETLYVWSEEDGTLVEASGGGSGSGFYNVTLEQPLETGYYTKETAVAAMAATDVDDEQKPGMIMTFEAAAGKWLDYRFEGTDTSSFGDAAAWKRYGGGDAIKRLHVTKGTAAEELSPDEDGNVSLDIPVTEVDETLDENSTNPVQNKAIAAELKKMGGKYGAALQLNTIGEGDEKAYSMSLLDENGEVLSTSDQFTGGGGGSLQATKIELTRVTANPTVKMGDTVKLVYTYDQVDTATGESTGNPARAVVTVSRGANSSTLEATLAAGSTNTVDVTKYLGTGTNTVRVRVSVGEGAEQQVSQITWTVTVVQLVLGSSWNIASVINRGDTVSVPFALTGSGQKTLRCYVDGVDTEDRTIGTSTANGSFSIKTGGMAHGSHSVQFVAELEQGGGVIRSNSIYFDMAVRENGNDTPVFAARFDYSDGTIIAKGERPYIGAKQYDNYTLVYAAYDPKETPTEVRVYEGSTLISSASVAFTRTELTHRAMSSGRVNCRMECGKAAYTYGLHAEKSDLAVTDPTDGMTLKLSATGRSNSDVNREEWTYNGTGTELEGFKWGGDGWLDGALRLTDDARATVKFRPLETPQDNATNAMAFMVRFKVDNVTDEDTEIIRCMDADGTGFVITAQEARMVSRGGSTVTTRFATGEIYNIGFVAYPKAGAQSTADEKLNDGMLYLYVNGIMSGGVQRGASDGIYQGTPQYVTMGSNDCTLDVYSMRAYNTYLTDSQMLDAYMLDLGGADELIAKYGENDVLDQNGEITVDSLPEGLPYIIITGVQANGVATVLQAAVNNNKKTKYDITEALYVNKADPSLNFRLVGGCISLQGTSSLAYPTKNYRLYVKDSNKKKGQLYLGCDAQGVGGTLQESGKYSFRKATTEQKEAAPVDCWCFKADFAESSSSHNTGMAKMVQRVLTAADELTPAQRHVSDGYGYDVRTTIDGFPVMLFYRGTVDDTPQFLGKFNFNNDKSTEAVFGFLDIPGYHDQAWVTDKFGGQNPTECWEFLNNDYAMGMFLDDDFDAKDDDGTPHWLKVFEARFPDDDDRNAAFEAGTLKPTYLERLVKWVKGTKDDGAKFKAELGDYFDVDYLCDYYAFTDIMGCVDQRVKNMMMGFWYDPDRDKVLAYMIFYDCDTILGVRNDGRLKYGWDIDENTTDPELSTQTKTVYAYAGHDSVLWKNLREQFGDEIGAAYRRLRARMPNEYIFNIFDNEQSSKFCERIYNIDAQKKYVSPKTEGVEVNQNGAVTTVTYSYMEAMQGSRKAHRHWWLTNRLGLFDARYQTGQYTLTDLTFKGNSAAGATIRAWAARDFYFAFVREAATLIHSEVKPGKEWSYTYGQTANVGTIFHFYGGEYARKIDLSGWGGFTDLSLPRLARLEELVLGRTGSTYTLTEIAIGDKLPMLRTLDVRNYTMLPSLDLSECTRLETLNASGCSSLSTVNFAEGCPLSALVLPDGYQTLSLRYLPKLKRGGITFGNMRTLTGLWVEGCTQLDGFALFKEIFGTSGNRLRYVRIPDMELEGDGSDLKEWYDAGLGGIDADGNTVSGRCKIGGTYRLTKYLDEDVYAKYSERFDELNIRQPEYTMIEFDDTVADDANVSNGDNKTGYKYGNDYVPSAHISAILRQRHRVLAKVAKLPTSRKETIAGQEVDVNNTDGEMAYYPLDDADSNKYADGSAAKLDGSEGDWMVYEPFFWSKGVNDYLNGKHYSCYSSRGKDEMPSVPEATVLTLEDIKGTGGGYLPDRKIMTGKDTLQNSYTADTAYSVCKVSVKGYRRVRFPSVPGTSLVGSVFVDADGVVVSSVVVPTLSSRFEAGMYLVADVPEGADTLHFSILDTAEFDKVVLSNSGRIEDMEPDWVANDEHLCAVVGSTAVDGKLRACITGGSTTGSMTWTDFHYYSQQRGMQQVDALMHSRIANLFYAKYGRRDSQGQCGAGQHSYQRKTGGTAGHGMRDTIGYDAAKAIDPNATYQTGDAGVPQFAWYRDTEEYGTVKAVRVDNSCCLGYEDIYGNKYDMMDGVDLPNDSGNGGKWRIWMPDGTKRMVKGTTASGNWITGVVHGKWMDVVPAGNMNGSSSTYYSDTYWVSTAAGRVVYRGYYNASASGGVSYANAGNDASGSYAPVGSRLAFRGKIVRATSVSAYKAISEKA